MSTETLPSLSELRAQRKAEFATRNEPKPLTPEPKQEVKSPASMEELALSGSLMQKRMERQAAREQNQGQARGEGQGQEQARPDLAPGAGLFMGARKLDR